MSKISGYLYILFNDVFKKYGSNYYKVGKSIDVDQRAIAYITPYIDPSEIIYKSQPISGLNLADKIIEQLLINYRVRHKREFYQCPKNEIISAIKETVTQVNSGAGFEYLNSLYKIQNNSKLYFESFKKDL